MWSTAGCCRCLHTVAWLLAVPALLHLLTEHAQQTVLPPNSQLLRSGVWRVHRVAHTCIHKRVSCTCGSRCAHSTVTVACQLFSHISVRMRFARIPRFSQHACAAAVPYAFAALQAAGVILHIIRRRARQLLQSWPCSIQPALQDCCIIAVLQAAVVILNRIRKGKVALAALGLLKRLRNSTALCVCVCVLLCCRLLVSS